MDKREFVLMSRKQRSKKLLPLLKKPMRLTEVLLKLKLPESFRPSLYTTFEWMWKNNLVLKRGTISKVYYIAK